MDRKQSKIRIEKAYNDYVLGMKLKEIAIKYIVSINTVKSWSKRGKWCATPRATHTKKNTGATSKVQQVKVLNRVKNTSERIEKAYIDYFNNMKIKDIAIKHNVAIDTVKTWRKNNGWVERYRNTVL
ncbi:MAG: hypothetical protein ACRC5M_07340 [Anaeroplasmataceae bacterium]